MRLLEITTDGHLFFTEWFRRGDDVPPYAILSHTWEQGQEVTYDDWINGRAMDKKGYDKIRFLKMQCQRDGLKYFWIDTRCLIKEDPDEHHDALSSMFRWYQNATRCYVLLSDVLHSKPKAESSENIGASWVPAFEKSKWFTRDQDGNPVLTENIMDACGIFLVLQRNVVHFSHHLARDFLAQSTRTLPSGPKDGRRLIYERSLKVMSRILRQNLYELEDWGISVEDSEPSHDGSLSASRYSCIYWIEHLCESIMVDSTELPAQDAPEGFLSIKFSLYLEALSLCKGISSAISSIDKLRSLSKVT